ncbi:MAG: adenosine deaminase [Spirochaetes bacterium]|nr:adenosine deaminase [Spirochaetota bacterium]
MIPTKHTQQMPKIELHRHLEGAMRTETLRRFAAKKKLTAYHYQNPAQFRKHVEIGKNDKKDLLFFLSKFINVWYSSLEDVAQVAYESVEDAAKDNVLYYEMRFNPEHYAFVNNFKRDVVARTVIESARKAQKKYKNIDVKFLFTLNRGKQTIRDMEYMFDIAKSFNIDGLIGIDLAGDETNFPAKQFKQFFKKVKDAGLFGITIHAGECVGPFSVWDAIHYLHADRIGHGVAVSKDKKLFDYVVEHDITLEQCLTSNLQTGAVADIETHPFPKFYHGGVNATLNTDDPSIERITLSDDYAIAAKTFKFSIEDFKQINLNAIKASFLGFTDKEKLKERYLSAFAQFEKSIAKKRRA